MLQKTQTVLDPELPEPADSHTDGSAVVDLKRLPPLESVSVIPFA